MKNLLIIQVFKYCYGTDYWPPVRCESFRIWRVCSLTAHSEFREINTLVLIGSVYKNSLYTFCPAVFVTVWTVTVKFTVICAQTVLNQITVTFDLNL
jgi:hypothetical protein